MFIAPSSPSYRCLHIRRRSGKLCGAGCEGQTTPQPYELSAMEAAAKNEAAVRRYRHPERDVELH